MKIPPRNLSPEATPWAAWAERAITDLQTEMERRTQNETNANKAQSGANATLGTQIQRLNEVVARLADPVSANESAIDFVLTGTLAEVVTVPVTVPENFTRAIVLCTATGGLKNDQPSGYSTLRLYAQVAGGGTLSSSRPLVERMDAGSFGVRSVSHATELEGLESGDIVHLSAFMSFGNAHSLTSATVSGLVTWAP